MPLRLQRYRTLFAKGLLMAGYLFFFASQFNGRYFTIANFYVYHSNSTLPNTGARLSKANGTAATAVSRTAIGQHPIALQNNSQRPAHLGIDKRYQIQQGIRVSQIRAPGVVCFCIVKTRFYSFRQVFFSTDSPTCSLRGPPCA